MFFLIFEGFDSFCKMGDYRKFSRRLGGLIFRGLIFEGDLCREIWIFVSKRTGKWYAKVFVLLNTVLLFRIEKCGEECGEACGRFEEAGEDGSEQETEGE